MKGLQESPLFATFTADDLKGKKERHLRALKYLQLEQLETRDVSLFRRIWYVGASFVKLVIIKPRCRRRKQLPSQPE